jgi:hypothetical protein
LLSPTKVDSAKLTIACVCWHNEMWRVSEFVLPDGSKLRRHGNFETAQAAHEAWKKLCLQHRGGIYQLAKGNKSGSVQCQCGEDCKCGFEVKGVLLEQLNAKGWWSPKPDQVWIGRELIRDECISVMSFHVRIPSISGRVGVACLTCCSRFFRIFFHLPVSCASASN